MAHFQLIFILTFFCVSKAQSHDLSRRVEFLKGFLQGEGRSSTIVSHMQLSKKEHVQMCKMLAADHKQFKIAPNIQNTLSKETGDVVHLVDLHGESARDLLYKAIKDGLIKSPSRWLLFTNNRNNDLSSLSNDRCNDINTIANDYIDEKRAIEDRFANLYIDISTEVYVAFQRSNCVLLYSVYKIKAHLPLIWEDFGVWTPVGFDRPRPAPAAVRRRDLRGADVVVPTVLLHNRTLEDLPDYLHRERDTMTKLVYYMCTHLVEWVNGTKVLNRTTSWGYLQPDGQWDGIVREMQDGRADLAGSCMIAQKERVKYVNYFLAPSKIEAMFVFKKPALASVTNIYVLPFDVGVWISTVLLIIISSFTLFLSSFGEDRMKNYNSKSWLQKTSDGFFDTLCLVFQQGTAADPLSIASRQILLLGLMAFMFLYTAYSANVVALLQSPTNDINSVETLLTSPVACGSQDVVYAWQMFGHESRPIHRLLADRKINSQGKKGFLSVEDGIRKVREGMFAFHVEQTAGFDQIQKTFLEDEKCNLGFIKYMSTTSPFVAFSQITPIKEMLRIGANRIMEVGVQSRSARRLVPERPRCGASAAMFNAVRLSDVAPAFRVLLAFYALTLPIFGLEILVKRREMKRENCDSKSVDTATEEITENIII
ncbi:glutamate receptor 3-like [Cydia fagiglandana]|uniref:glutamate receptor 3-like n=1 Tax=Cydia fagiglandana TaxID=1458189 RepID=UPI002FEE5BF8